MTQETQNMKAMDIVSEKSTKSSGTVASESTEAGDYESDIYFQKCCEEDYDFNFKTQSQIDKCCINLIKKNFKQWENVLVDTVDFKDISGHGGSKTYQVQTSDESVCQEYRKLVFHQRKLDEIDPLTDERMLEAHKAMWKSGVAIPRLVSGKNWWFEQFVEGICGHHSADKVDQLDYAVLMAKLHKNTSTEWFEKHRQRAIEMYPILKDISIGSHVWLYTTRLSWFKKYEHSHELFTKTGFEPLSEAGKRITVVHGDIHPSNVIVRDDSKSCFVDFEFTAPHYAVHDLAYTFADWNKCTRTDQESKYSFCKKYLEELGLPNDDEQVELLVFDAECARLRNRSTLNQDMEKKLRDEDYDCKLYKACVKFEETARADKELIRKIAQNGFFKVADETEFIKPIRIEEKKVEEEKRIQREKDYQIKKQKYKESEKQRQEQRQQRIEVEKKKYIDQESDVNKLKANLTDDVNKKLHSLQKEDQKKLVIDFFSRPVEDRNSEGYQIFAQLLESENMFTHSYEQSKKEAKNKDLPVPEKNKMLMEFVKCLELEIIPKGECCFHHEEYGEEQYYIVKGNAKAYIRKDRVSLEKETKAIKEKFNKIESNACKTDRQGYYEEDTFDLFYEKYQEKMPPSKDLRKSLYALYKESADNKFQFDNFEQFIDDININDWALIASSDPERYFKNQVFLYKECFVFEECKDFGLSAFLHKHGRLGSIFAGEDLTLLYINADNHFKTFFG